MDLLKEEQKVTLFFQKDTVMVEMSCTIEKVYDDRLELNLPKYFMRYIEFLQVGKRLTAKAFSKLGTIDFNTVIISSPLEETFMVELDYNSVKLTPGTELPVISAVEPIEIFQGSETLYYKTFEISTDYVKFYSDRALEIESLIKGTIKLPKDYGTIKFEAIITEIDEIYENEYTVLYSMMTETDRQNLLYYMYMYTKDSD